MCDLICTIYIQKTGSSTNKVTSFMLHFLSQLAAFSLKSCSCRSRSKRFCLSVPQRISFWRYCGLKNLLSAKKKKRKPLCSCLKGAKRLGLSISTKNNEEKLWWMILGSLHPASEFPASLLSRPRSLGLGMETLQAWHSYDVSWRPPQDGEPKALDVAYSGPLSKLAHGNGASRNVHD